MQFGINLSRQIIRIWEGINALGTYLLVQDIKCVQAGARRVQIPMVPARRGQMGQARPQQMPADIGACFIYEYTGR